MAEIARKFTRKLKRGKFDKQLFRELDAEMDRALQKNVQAAVRDPSKKNIKGAMYLIGQCQMLGMGGERTTNALTELGAQVARRAQVAESDFRGDPTLEKFKDYWHSRRQAEILGEGREYSTCPKRLHGDDSCTTKAGDTLRPLSKFFYGTEGAWDFIVGINMSALSVHLKRSDQPLPPGLRLTIPSR